MRDADFVRDALTRASHSAAARGMPSIELRGQLIRPLLAFAAAKPGERELTHQFWSGALAIQFAHEASLVHDDIVDEAKTRRGAPTAVQAHGVATALVLGDHLLTAAYRLAAETESLEFVKLFSQCVERTVAGEIAQANSLGRRLTFDEYTQIAESKSGELLGASLALSAALDDPARIVARARLGRKIGLLYQMLDDLLDYCPATDTGKPALGDFRQKRWTWPLMEVGEFSFDESCEDVAERLRRPSPDGSPLRRCLQRIELEADSLRAQLTEEFGGADAGSSLADEWVNRARQAVEKESGETNSASPITVTIATDIFRAKLPQVDDVVDYLGRNSKSFRFASRFFPRAELSRVAHVYTFCRITDDLVDKSHPSEAPGLLDQWMCLARNAYNGSRSGIGFLDVCMEQMRSREIPFAYADELAEGMRMDLRGETYRNITDLRRYTYRVASVVGLWLTELAGVRDSAALRHAEALGHAMQLTNIARDVGEDARNSRLYLPADMLGHHGISPPDITSAANGMAPIPLRFGNLMEDLLGIAEREYEFALEGMHYLPRQFQRPVAVAAHVYRGIHSEMRRAGYDTISRRAVTSGRSKAVYAFRAIWQLEAPHPLIRHTA